MKLKGIWDKIRRYKKGSWITYLWYKFKSLSIIKHILFIYLFITILGSLLLLTPWAHNSGVDTPSYLDDLFTAASAFSDTGLVTKATFLTWSFFGQAVIAIMIMVGGLGFFALKVYMFNIILGRPISFATRSALSAERGSTTVGVTRNLIRVTVTILFIIVAIASVVLSIYFYFFGADPLQDTINSAKKANLSEVLIRPRGNWATSIRYGIFHTVSALNNAGFDIIGSHSLSPYYNNYGLQIMFIILFIIGGIGYPVIYDIYKWIRSKFTGEFFKWTLFTKVSMLTYLVVALVGITLTFTIELTAHDYTNNGGISQTFWHDKQYGGRGAKSMALFFSAMSTRNAGFSTIDMHQLSSGTLVLFAILMFIGSAPSSTAGGIRTTTVAIIFLGVWSRVKNRTTVRAFNKRLPSDTVTRSFIVVAVAATIVLIGIMVGFTSFAEHGGKINSSIENEWHHLNSNYHEEYSSTELFFEVASAFGTTGLSTGLTPNLSQGTLVVLIFIMFIGQLGVSSTVLLWGNKKSRKRKYNFVKEDLATG